VVTACHLAPGRTCAQLVSSDIPGGAGASGAAPLAQFRTRNTAQAVDHSRLDLNEALAAIAQHGPPYWALGQRRSDGMMGRIRAMRFRSSGLLQVGATGVALTVGAAVRGLAAVAEPRKVAWIAGRPAAGACRQVDDGEAPVDRLLMAK
jgi:hypothetical protein